MNIEKDKPYRRRAAWAAMRLAGLYIALATLWLLISDRLLALLPADIETAHWLQTLKGLAFVAVTGSLLFLLCYRRFAALLRTQQQLRESRRAHRTLLDNLPGMAYRCLHDEHWTMLLVSNGGDRLTGYSAEELTHNRRVSYQHLIHPDDAETVRRKVDEAVTRRLRFRLEYRIRAADGAERWVWEQGAPVYDDAGRLLALEGFITDITERKRNETLERERDHLRRNAETMRQALGVVGHELRTPLAGLRAMAEYLLTDGAQHAEESDGLLRGIHDETVRMADMVNNMLEGARLDSGAARWNWGCVRLRAVCEEALDVVRPLIDADRVRLLSKIDPPDLAIHGDADALRRLLINLLTNAHKHTPHGDIRILIDRDRQREPDAPPRVRIRIADTGRGIAPDVAERLGHAFALNRGDVGLGYLKGVGLGLAICRGIVTAHAGAIRVASAKGRGTTFTVTLRADLDQPASAPTEVPIEQQTPTPGSSAPGTSGTPGSRLPGARGRQCPAGPWNTTDPAADSAGSRSS